MDGYSEAYWNADQLLVWVWCCDRELVRRAADGFTDYGTYLQELKQPDGRVVMTEAQNRWMGLSGLELHADMQPRRNLSEIRAEVLNVLRDGRLHALGLENGEGDLEKISDGQWAGLSFYEDRNFRTYASPDDHFRRGATKWYGLKFKRIEVLEIWPDPIESCPRVITTQLLVPLEDRKLGFKLKLDSWTLTEALFILHGYEPPGFETSDELMTHFINAYSLAVNSIKSGTLCREIKMAGEKRYIESPARWFAWALEKDLPVAEMVRAKMAAVQRTDERALGDTYTTPLAVLFDEVPDVRDWFQAPSHTLEDCICYLMNKHISRITKWGDGYDDFERFEKLGHGFIHAGELRAKKDDGVYWIERQDFIAWARKIDLGVFVQNLDELEACMEPVETIVREEVNRGTREASRVKPSRSYERHDKPLLEKMKKLYDSGEVTSIWAAAGRFADEAIGGGTSESKQKRLHGGYMKMFGETQR